MLDSRLFMVSPETVLIIHGIILGFWIFSPEITYFFGTDDYYEIDLDNMDETSLHQDTQGRIHPMKIMIL